MKLLMRNFCSNSRNSRSQNWPSSRRNTSKARLARRFLLWPEFLEERITPTGNIAITGVSVVDSSDKAFSVVNVGEQVYIQVNYTTQGLPSNASYRISFTVNGLTLSTGYLSNGAGGSGTGNWYEYWGTFNASAGTNQVSVTVDPDDSVAESSYADNTSSTTFSAVSPSVGSLSYSAAQMRNAYGINSIPNIGNAAADGSGQTIAIVDAANNPNIFTNLDGFDVSNHLTISASQTLYQQYGAASSILTVYNQSGVNISSEIATSGANGVPDADPSGSWEGEESLDVDWVHAIAPGAKIDLIETNFGTGSTSDNLFDGVATAAALPNVSVVSNSWIYSEFSGETAHDQSTFQTPSGHTGVTFLAATGDSGMPGGYPAFSPNVVAVGGTQLSVLNDGYGSETGWSYPTPRTLNVGGSSYSQSGTWSSQSGGFSGSYSTAPGGSSSSATWSTSITSTDQGWISSTEVSATWTPSATNATNATYTIYDGSQASGDVLGTVVVDQTKAPVGTADGGSLFQRLGVYTPSSGTLTVVLNAKSSTGTVVADAIGISQGWASGGGQSQYEAEPSFQVPFQSTGYRTTPDVSFDASQFSTGDGYYGTSLACPCWAGLIAIANQGRIADGGITLNSPSNPTQTLQALYSLSANDFHDVTIGYNGYSAGTGYDQVTGRGTPIANLLVPDLISYQMADQLVVATQPPVNVTAGQSFGLTVDVEDSSGNTATTYNGPVTISLNQNPGNSILNGNMTVTAVNGVATFTGLTLDIAASGYTIGASGNGLSPTTSTGFNILAAAPAQLLASSEPPSSVKAGAGFGLVVTVEDAFGNPVTNDEGNVTVSLVNGPIGSILGGTETVVAVNGVATFSGLTLNETSSGDILGISRPGLSGSITSAITVTPAAPAQLAITQLPPLSVNAGAGLGFLVAIEDPFGNLILNSSATVTVKLASGTGPLLGTTSVVTVLGIASFTNLYDDRAETVSLSFASAGLIGVTSSKITVMPATASQLVIVGQPSSTATAGLAFATQPVIDEEDPFGNLVTSDSSTVVTATLASGAGPLQGTMTAIVSGGVARFKNLGDKSAGTITLGFGSGSLSAATSTPIVVGKATPTIAWPTPAAIAFGTLLTGSQLDATTSFNGSTVAGTFAYSPAMGAILPSGPQKLSVIFTPTDANDFTTVSASTTINVFVVTYTALSIPSTTATFGQSVTLTATVSATNGGTTPTGTVTFYNGATILGTSTLGTTGHAILSTAGLSIGIDSISVKYSGNSIDTATASPSTPLYVSDLVKEDFLGDGKDDLTYYGIVPGTKLYGFVTLTAATGYNPSKAIIWDNQGFGFGNASSIPVPADYFGEGKPAYAIWSPDGHGYMILQAISSVNPAESLSVDFGLTTDVPVVADVDGDGKVDFGVYGYDANLGYRYDFLLSSKNFSPSQPLIFNNYGYGYGTPGATPVVADFDGSGHAGFGVYIPSGNTGTFTYINVAIPKNTTGAIVNPPASYVFTRTYGFSTDIPMAVDFDGDGKADLAFYGLDPRTGKYRYDILTSSTNFSTTKDVYFDNAGYGYGYSASIPIMADYDGNGQADFGVFQPDGSGGASFIFQYVSVGHGVVYDDATPADLPIDAPTYLLAKKVRGH